MRFFSLFAYASSITGGLQRAAHVPLLLCVVIFQVGSQSRCSSIL